MSTTTTTNPYLVGNYAPVQSEVTHTDLTVTGDLPEALDGTLLRNGPNPFGPTSPNHHWFLGDGMVHGIRMRHGGAEWYRNRWVRSERLADRGGPAAAKFADHRSSMSGMGGVNVISHADRILALGEVGLPWHLDGEIDTLEECDFDGAVSSNVTAHPKIDPATGGLVFFGYDFGPVTLRYHEADATGRVVHSVEVPTKGPTMIHDCGVTATRFVVMDLPVCFDLDTVAAGREMPFAWNPSYGARIGVLPRFGAGDDVTWIEIDPCYVFHCLNVHDDGPRIVMDVARYPKMFDADLLGPHEENLSVLVRWVIDPEAGTVTSTVLDDRPQEFPRVDPRVETLPHRYGFGVTLAGTGGLDSADLLRHDLEAGTSQVHTTGEGRFPSEGVFVPAAPDAAEGEGWVLAPVYDASTDRSEIIVVDAMDFTAPPVATIQLPVRIPFGFHGNWVPAG